LKRGKPVNKEGTLWVYNLGKKEREIREFGLLKKL